MMKILVLEVMQFYAAPEGVPRKSLVSRIKQFVSKI
jgi:hypothetical protein